MCTHRLGHVQISEKYAFEYGTVRLHRLNAIQMNVNRDDAYEVQREDDGDDDDFDKHCQQFCKSVRTPAR